MSQEDLNCSLVGACDLFDVNLELALDASENETRPGGKPKNIAKKYKDYRDLLADDEIDAVIVATPDHWHSRIVIDAARAGKHVYCEKGLTRTFDEAIDVYDAVSMSCIVPLSELSIKQNSSSIKIPDFTRGRWKTNKPIFGLNDSY